MNITESKYNLAPFRVKTRKDINIINMSLNIQSKTSRQDPS